MNEVMDETLSLYSYAVFTEVKSLKWLVSTSENSDRCPSIMLYLRLSF